VGSSNSDAGASSGDVVKEPVSKREVRKLHLIARLEDLCKHGPLEYVATLKEWMAADVRAITGQPAQYDYQLVSREVDPAFDLEIETELLREYEQANP
jgi:hypothetical protein